VASPILLPAQPDRRGGRMLSDLAPVMMTTLSLIPSMKFSSRCHATPSAAGDANEVKC
jgi:hypothetical protein